MVTKMERWLFGRKKQYFMPGLILILILFSGLGSLKRFQQDRTIAVTQPVSANRVIQVEVHGAVRNPGLYVLDDDSRVFQAIAAAGGLIPGAYSEELNLAEHLYNGQRLEIPYVESNQNHGSTATPVVLSNEMIEGLPAGVNEQKSSETVLVTSTPFDHPCDEPATGIGVFMWPVYAHFLSGKDFTSDHPGIDLAAGMGSPVYAADSGVVRMAGNDDRGYGNVIEIDHGNGYSTVYAHLSMIEVSVCRNVYAGQRIGLAGSTGNAVGAHLHFEVLDHGEYIPPWSLLPEP